MDKQRNIEFSPAFDKRTDDPNTNRGIHGAEMRWLLKGDKGVVQFVVYTNWHLPHIQQELEARANRGGEYSTIMLTPQPVDLGYHSYVPMYDGQSNMGHCNYLGCDCYYDGNSTQAHIIFDTLVEKGHEAVWEKMEKYYQSIFGGPSYNESTD